jgi:hypothetical protein
LLGADADEPQRVCSGNLQTELRQNAQILPQSLRPLLRMIVELQSRRPHAFYFLLRCIKAARRQIVIAKIR